MEPNPQLLTSCLGKTGFVSRGNAEKALRELRRKGRLKHAGPDRADKSRIEIYNCDFCGLYHHGHSKRQSQKLIRSRKADLG